MGIERGYQQFLTVVSEGRNLSIEEVDKIAQGRVWTGVDAKSLGLVDQLGNLQDAIEAAAKQAQLNDYIVSPIVKTISAKQQLLNEILASGVKIVPESLQINSTLLNTLGDIQQQATLLNSFNDPKGHYAYCPMCFITH